MRRPPSVDVVSTSIRRQLNVNPCINIEGKARTSCDYFMI